MQKETRKTKQRNAQCLLLTVGRRSRHDLPLLMVVLLAGFQASSTTSLSRHRAESATGGRRLRLLLRVHRLEEVLRDDDALGERRLRSAFGRNVHELVRWRGQRFVLHGEELLERGIEVVALGRGQRWHGRHGSVGKLVWIVHGRRLTN